ncbi:MAG: hypothetical protein AAFP92_30265, partial [Bacteroidota bacterium]
WESLSQTRSLMQVVKAPEVQAPSMMLFAEKKNAWWQNKWFHAAAAGIALLLCARLLGLQVSVKDQVLTMRFGDAPPTEQLTPAEQTAVFPVNQPTPTEIPNDSLFRLIHQLGQSLEAVERANKRASARTVYSSLEEDQMADLKAEITEANYRLMVDMMGQAQKYQQAYTQEILKEFSAYLDRQRRQDLELMEVAFNQIIEQNDEQQEETHYLLTELMTQIQDDQTLK